MSANRVLVLGGTGKTGRRVAARMAARGLAVRIGSRTAAPPFDWEQPATWREALHGVDAAYVAYHPDLAAPGAADAIQSLTALAAASGVRRLVLLSGRGEPEAQRCEQIVRDSGLEWTLVRASWFAQNFSESYLRDAVLAGEVALPVGAVGEPFVDADDIADVAAAALTEAGHAGQLYEVTGPRLWTFAEAVAEIGRATAPLHPLRAGVPRGICRGAARRPASRAHGRAHHLSLRRGPGRAERLGRRRRDACAGPAAARLRRLRERCGRERRLESGLLGEDGMRLHVLDLALISPARSAPH